MNHQRIYDAIIEKARSENRKKLKKTDINYIYYENHHIIPRCLNGNEEKNNKVLLTAKEHFVCHKLLTYIYKGNRKIACAYHYMTFNKKYNKIYKSARDYSYAKEIFILTIDTKKENNGMYGRSVYDIWVEKFGKEIADIKNLEKNQKISKSNKGHIVTKKSKQKMKNHIRTEEHKQHLRESLKGHIVSKETRKKQSIAAQNHIVSKETRNKQIPWEHSSLLDEVFFSPPKNRNIPSLLVF
jgi:hypothetical protein